MSFLSFFILLTHAVILQPFTKIAVLNDQPFTFFILHSWRHPGRAKILCIWFLFIHKYTTFCCKVLSNGNRIRLPDIYLFPFKYCHNLSNRSNEGHFRSFSDHHLKNGLKACNSDTYFSSHDLNNEPFSWWTGLDLCLPLNHYT